MPCWILNVITVKVTGARAPEGPCGEEPPHANDVNSAAAAIARKYRIPPSEQRRCRRTEARACLSAATQFRRVDGPPRDARPPRLRATDHLLHILPRSCSRFDEVLDRHRH